MADEEEVLQWLLKQQSEDTIETVNRAMLEALIQETEYLAVFICKFMILLQFFKSVKRCLFLYDNITVLYAIRPQIFRMLFLCHV